MRLAAGRRAILRHRMRRVKHDDANIPVRLAWESAAAERGVRAAVERIGVRSAPHVAVAWVSRHRQVCATCPTIRDGGVVRVGCDWTRGEPNLGMGDVAALVCRRAMTGRQENRRRQQRSAATPKWSAVSVRATKRPTYGWLLPSAVPFVIANAPVTATNTAITTAKATASLRFMCFLPLDDEHVRRPRLMGGH